MEKEEMNSGENGKENKLEEVMNIPLCESPGVTQMLMNEDSPSEAVSSSSLSGNSDSGETDPLSRAIDRLSLKDDIQKTERDQNIFEVDGAPVSNKSSRWESLPWPAFNRICFHLRTDGDCSDLASLAEVSTHFNAGVTEFMKKDDNRPGIDYVDMAKTDNGVLVRMKLYPSNIRFYSLDTQEAGRFKRRGGSPYPRLEVTLNGPGDALFKQVSDLLSSHINLLIFNGLDFTPSYFSSCSQLLLNSSFGQLNAYTEILDDFIAPFILSLASNTMDIEICCHQSLLSDPTSFISQLYSDVFSCSLFNCSPPFFNLPHSFWTKFLNEKLANGSFESIKTGNMKRKVKKAPFDLPDTAIKSLKWHKKM
ncbi:hypothetical protein PMAYCL1PPCAC_22892 [Pristionchus mayeri]|uniref:Uncharacterized protein n=1 Tax=Pristionchus mayeri TaxID=1317129 RepID=A0AAN5CY61_9BILA|nr:hypothetical protein PMAYCL1PPCAC_22892 [Pristionchus mayeri]